jgi:type VI protein secretion system component Hcp
MTSAPLRLSRVSTATAILFALAAAPAAAGPAFLKLGGVEGETARPATRDEWVKVEGNAMPAAEGKKDFYKGWIELNSWSWGTTGAAASASKTMTMKGSKIGENSTDGDPDRPLVTGRVPNAAKESGEKGGTEDINIGVGELQEATISKSSDKSTPKLMEAAAKGKVLSTPAPRGSMTTLVPAGTCRAGARYPGATLDTGQMRFVMENIMVTSCSSGGGSGGESLPMEEISFNYGKITTVYGKQDKAAPKVKVRGWDPEKKEE